MTAQRRKHTIVNVWIREDSISRSHFFTSLSVCVCQIIFSVNSNILRGFWDNSGAVEEHVGSAKHVR